MKNERLDEKFKFRIRNVALATNWNKISLNTKMNKTKKNKAKQKYI